MLYSYFLQQRVVSDSRFAVTVSSTFLAALSLCHFISAPVLGAVTDSVGRRPVLVVGMTVAIFVFFVMGFLTNASAYIGLGVLLGLFDGSAAAAYTVVVDCAVVSPPTESGGQSDWLLNQLLFWLVRPKGYDVAKTPDLELELRAHFILVREGTRRTRRTHA